MVPEETSRIFCFLLVVGSLVFVWIWIQSRKCEPIKKLNKVKVNITAERRKILESLKMPTGKTLSEELEGGGRAEFSDRDILKSWKYWSGGFSNICNPPCYYGCLFPLESIDTTNEEMKALGEKSYWRAVGKKAINDLRNNIEEKGFDSEESKNILVFYEAVDFLGVRAEYFGTSDKEITDLEKNGYKKKAELLISEIRQERIVFNKKANLMLTSVLRSGCDIREILTEEEIKEFGILV